MFVQQENIKILPSGALALTNITANMSGDYFYCEIGWNDHMTTYNATYQMNVDICEYDDNIYFVYLKIVLWLSHEFY